MKKKGAGLFLWSSSWASCGLENKAHSIASCLVVITERQVPPLFSQARFALWRTSSSASWTYLEIR